ncbi:hypothetical protein EDC94DRAFT_513431, partial [Helicostylum pulchrum]
IPGHFLTSTCPICSDLAEPLLHFITTCPSKLQVWQSVWNSHIDPSESTVSTYILQITLFTLTPPLAIQVSKLQALLVAAATIESIWRSHWVTFDNTRFAPTHIIASLMLLIAVS